MRKTRRRISIDFLKATSKCSSTCRYCIRFCSCQSRKEPCSSTTSLLQASTALADHADHRGTLRRIVRFKLVRLAWAQWAGFAYATQRPYAPTTFGAPVYPLPPAVSEFVAARSIGNNPFNRNQYREFSPWTLLPHLWQFFRYCDLRHSGTVRWLDRMPCGLCYRLNIDSWAFIFTMALTPQFFRPYAQF
jgi:hypothetical protein